MIYSLGVPKTPGFSHGDTRGVPLEKWGQELVELEVMPDHVHILVGCDPQFGIHKFVRLIKGASARML